MGEVILFKNEGTENDEIDAVYTENGQDYLLRLKDEGEGLLAELSYAKSDVAEDPEIENYLQVHVNWDEEELIQSTSRPPEPPKTSEGVERLCEHLLRPAIQGKTFDQVWPYDPRL